LSPELRAMLMNGLLSSEEAKAINDFAALRKDLQKQQNQVLTLRRRMRGLHTQRCILSTAFAKRGEEVLEKNTLQHPSAPFRTLQHPSAPFSTLQHPSAPFSTLPHPSAPFRTLQHPSAPFSTLQHPSAPFSSRILRVSVSYTSKQCGGCGVLNETLAKSKTFTCTPCGLEADRDARAAHNIPLRTLPCHDDCAKGCDTCRR
jgi:hypothetical protein